MCLALAVCARERPLRLGTTFTVEQSGALISLDTIWTGPHFDILVAASGQTLRSAAAGDLDVVITHAPALERRLLVESGRAARACPLFASRFGIAGPPEDPAGVRGMTSGVAALRRIGAVGAVFVSRGDSSGTHQKERELWRLAGIDPDPRPWHIESGASQAANVRQADHWRGYTLVDLPTWANLRRSTDLELLVAPPGDTALANPYTMYLVKPLEGERYTRGAEELARVLATTWRDHVLRMRLADGAAAFAPRGGSCTQPGG